jgi:hypothetical protein
MATEDPLRDSGNRIGFSDLSVAVIPAQAGILGRVTGFWGAGFPLGRE